MGWILLIFSRRGSVERRVKSEKVSRQASDKGHLGLFPGVFFSFLP